MNSFLEIDLAITGYEGRPFSFFSEVGLEAIQEIFHPFLFFFER